MFKCVLGGSGSVVCDRKELKEIVLIVSCGGGGSRGL